MCYQQCCSIIVLIVVRQKTTTSSAMSKNKTRDKVNVNSSVILILIEAL